jgi:hypothetical protein
MSSPVVAGAITSVCVDGGDAAELQTRVRAALAAAAGGSVIADCRIAGTGVGPRWLAELLFTDTPYVGGAAAALTAAYCVQGGDPAELNQRIQAILSLPNQTYIAVEIAGAGAGRDYMALILQETGIA